MNWRISTKLCDESALDFCKVWLYKFDCDSMSHVKVKRGKYGFGVYGWLDHIDGANRPYEMVLHIPGPYPFRVATKEPPLVLPLPGLKKSIPSGQVITSRNVCLKEQTVSVKLESSLMVNTPGEALVFLFGHELHHYLVAEEQIDAEDTEKNADMYGNLLLDRFRKIVK